MARELEVYINTEDIDTELKLGSEIALDMRDLTPGRKKYKWSFIKGVVSKEPGGDKLWVRFQRGILHPEPYYIKIAKEEPLNKNPFAFERM